MWTNALFCAFCAPNPRQPAATLKAIVEPLRLPFSDLQRGIDWRSKHLHSQCSCDCGLCSAPSLAPPLYCILGVGTLRPTAPFLPRHAVGMMAQLASFDLMHRNFPVEYSRFPMSSFISRRAARHHCTSSTQSARRAHSAVRCGTPPSFLTRPFPHFPHALGAEISSPAPFTFPSVYRFGTTRVSRQATQTLQPGASRPTSPSRLLSAAMAAPLLPFSRRPSVILTRASKRQWALVAPQTGEAGRSCAYTGASQGGRRPQE